MSNDLGRPTVRCCSQIYSHCQSASHYFLLNHCIDFYNETTMALLFVSYTTTAECVDLVWVMILHTIQLNYPNHFLHFSGRAVVSLRLRAFLPPQSHKVRNIQAMF